MHTWAIAKLWLQLSGWFPLQLQGDRPSHECVWAQTLLLLGTPFPLSCLTDVSPPLVIQQFSFFREGDYPGWAAKKQMSNCRWFLVEGTTSGKIEVRRRRGDRG